MSILNDLTEEEKQKLGMGTQEKRHQKDARMNERINELLSIEKNNIEKKTGQNVILPKFKSNKAVFTAWLITKKNPPMSIDDAMKIDTESPEFNGLSKDFSEFIASTSVRTKTTENGNEVSFYNTAIPDMLGEAEQIMSCYVVPDVSTKDNYLANAETLIGMKDMHDEISNQFNNAINRDKPYDMDTSNIVPTDELTGNIFNADFTHSFVAESGFTKNPINNIFEKHNNMHKFFNSVIDNYENLEYQDPLAVLAIRNQFKNYKGKTIADASTKSNEYELSGHMISQILNFENDISENRVVDHLMGEEDKELDNLVSYNNTKGITTSLKIKSAMINSKVSTKIDNHYKEIKKSQAKKPAVDFKLNVEIVGNVLKQKLNSAADDLGALFLTNSEGDLNDIINGIDELDKQITYANHKIDIKPLNTSEVIRDVTPTMSGTYVVVDGQNNTSTIIYDVHNKMNEYNNQIINGVAMLKETIDNMNPYMRKLIDNNPEKKAKLDNLLETIELIDKMAQTDQHFIDKTSEMDHDHLTLTQVKNEYGKDYPEAAAQYNERETNIKNWLTSKPGEANFNSTLNNLMTVNNNQNVTVNNDAPKQNINNEPVQINNSGIVNDNTIGFKGTRLTNIWYNRKDNVLSADKRIESIQKQVESQPEGATYDQFVNILAIRQAVGSVRGSGKSLQKDIFDIDVERMSIQMKDNTLIKGFYESVKSDPAKWAKFSSAISKGKGHGGAVEDMIKEYSNSVPLDELPKDNLTERYLPTVKERIEYYQKGVENGSIKDVKSAAAEILVCRNMAEAVKGKKNSLDKRITSQMIKSVEGQETELITNNTFMESIGHIKQDQLVSLINKGHGGELSEKLRFMTDNRLYTKENKAVHNIAWKNTLKAAVNETNGKIKNIQQATVDALSKIQGDNPQDAKDAAKNELNKFFPQLVAESVILGKMYKDAKASKNQLDLRTDFDKTVFRNKVSKLMDSPKFQATYNKMMTSVKGNETFSIDSIVKNYNDASRSMKEASKTKQKAPNQVQQGGIKK